MVIAVVAVDRVVILRRSRDGRVAGQRDVEQELVVRLESPAAGLRNPDEIDRAGAGIGEDQEGIESAKATVAALRRVGGEIVIDRRDEIARDKKLDSRVGGDQAAQRAAAGIDVDGERLPGADHDLEKLLGARCSRNIGRNVRDGIVGEERVLLGRPQVRIAVQVDRIGEAVVAGRGDQEVGNVAEGEIVAAETVDRARLDREQDIGGGGADQRIAEDAEAPDRAAIIFRRGSVQPLPARLRIELFRHGQLPRMKQRVRGTNDGAVRCPLD